jgi:hypothetical protein
MLCCYINGKSQLTFSVISLSGSYSITCTHSAITLSASSNYTSPVTYTWSTPQLNTVITNTLSTSNPGVYTITASSGSISASQTLAVGINTSIPSVSITSSSNSITCSTGTVLLTGIVSPTNVTYTWFGGGDDLGCNSFTCIKGAAGIYTLSVTNLSNGCKNTATIQIRDGRIYPMLSPNNLFTVSCPNGTVDLSVSVQNPTVNLSYHWFPPTGAITNATNMPVLNTNAPGTYTLLLTNTLNGCSIMTLVSVYACVGLEEVILNSTKVFPNPVHEELFIQFSADPGNIKVTLSNIFGQVLKTRFLDTNGSLDFLDIPTGVYFICFESGMARKILKVIKD